MFCLHTRFTLPPLTSAPVSQLCQLAFTFHIGLYSSGKLMLTNSSWLNNYLSFGVLTYVII